MIFPIQQICIHLHEIMRHLLIIALSFYTQKESDLFPNQSAARTIRGGSLEEPIRICYPPGTKHDSVSSPTSPRSASLGHETREMITVPRSFKQQ